MICPICHRRFRGPGVTANMTEHLSVQLCYRFTCSLAFAILKVRFDRLPKMDETGSSQEIHLISDGKPDAQ